MKRLLTFALAVCALVTASAQNRMSFSVVSSDSGHIALGLALRKLNVSATFMLSAAHPDDEHNALFALYTRGMGLRSIDLQTNRGEGGQNEIGLLLQFNSGLPVNIPANQDLNKDGTNSDRPLFVARNSLYLPARKNVDMRYTRWIPIAGSTRGEVIVELKNVFNTRQLSGINTQIAVDAAGNPLSAIPSDPYDFVNPSGYEQRKLQLGFKVRF